MYSIAFIRSGSFMAVLSWLAFALCMSVYVGNVHAQPAQALVKDQIAEHESAQSLNTVNVNQADAAALAAMLTGVGERKAQAIVAFREDHGPYKSLEELKQVKGIGESILARNKDLIVLQ